MGDAQLVFEASFAQLELAKVTKASSKARQVFHGRCTRYLPLVDRVTRSVKFFQAQLQVGGA